MRGHIRSPVASGLNAGLAPLTGARATLSVPVQGAVTASPRGDRPAQRDGIAKTPRCAPGSAAPRSPRHWPGKWGAGAPRLAADRRGDTACKRLRNPGAFLPCAHAALPHRTRRLSRSQPVPNAPARRPKPWPLGQAIGNIPLLVPDRPKRGPQGGCSSASWIDLSLVRAPRAPSASLSQKACQNLRPPVSGRLVACESGADACRQPMGRLR